MNITPLKLAGAFSIELSPVNDERGSFSRIFCQREFKEIRPGLKFVQVNISCNKKMGTIRGMHYQLSPSAEAKLVGCMVGRALDVIVDIRKGSPTFLQHDIVELGVETNRMVFIPEGFAHGFQTLCDDTRLTYFHTQYYAPECEAGINFADPAVGIEWPLDLVIASEKDQARIMLTSDFQGVDIP
jgi:dTDP-4-dehydrorhamnose 3,5-epimerase